MLKKICKKCYEEKSYEEFYAELRNTDGLMGACRKCVVIENKKWAKKNPKKWKIMTAKARRKWRYNNIDKVRDYKRNWAIILKEKILDHYGRKCKCCGETNTDFLTFDHINNDGAEQRRKNKMQGGGAVYYWIRKNNYPATLQVLCFNCNWSKHLIKNNNQCIHQVKKVEQYIEQINLRKELKYED